MTSGGATKQEFVFQAEIKQLLHLLSHSLYQSREIALRELISNASDACDKMRFVGLSDAAQRETGDLFIRLEPREVDGTLTIVDNGVGMTHDELIKNLGTIAHSGSLTFLNNLSGDARKDLSLIGQFGVGFYAAFMIADKVRVRSRSYSSDEGWEWESDGSGSFSLTPADDLERGTRVILHLKEDAKDLLKEYRLREVVRRYSSFVPHPIKFGDQVLNDAKPIWVEPKSKLTEDQYNGFYQHLTHRGDEKPLWHLHVSADSPIQFSAVLYCPPNNIELLGYSRIEHGLSLCAKRILVQSDCTDLLPEYLRFIYGLVDSEDLPLNVSRETLQDSSVFRKIRHILVRKVLDRLDELANEKPSDYLNFYRQFGAILREGVNMDFEHRERIAKLLRFHSSANASSETFTSLDEYVKRAPDAQKQIYYLGGPSLETIEKSPNLEVFRRRGLEVLFLTDPIDEFVLTALDKFGDKAIRSIDASDLELPPDESASEEVKSPPVAGLGRILELFRQALEDRVSDVRESTRLTDSPCCLVQGEKGMSPRMEKLIKLSQHDFVGSKRVMEINPKSTLVARLAELSGNPDHDEFIKQCARQLFGNALLLEGQLPEPREAVARTQAFMEELAGKRSPLVL